MPGTTIQAGERLGSDAAEAGATISLEGAWRFELDPADTGVAQKWFGRNLRDEIKLPGTTDENRKGTRKDERCEDRLSRVFYWKGPAWYQREVIIPISWQGKRVTLFLERSKHTRVWVDETECGTQDSLSAPLIFDLTKAMAPGRHVLTLVVDNAKLPPVGQAHAFDERTQSNWNGIIGGIEIRATDPVWLEDVQVYPEVARRIAVVRATIRNITGEIVRGKAVLGASSRNVASPGRFAEKTFNVSAGQTENLVEFEYPLGKDVPLWDEFRPALIHLRIRLNVEGGTHKYRDSAAIDFGMREFKTRGTQFTINGLPTFLRGKHDACIFPLTGYPPMDKAGWLRVMRIAKSYGINHYRFHSWCPPDAAFQAADELGIYLQPELPNKATDFERPDHGGYLRREGELIFKAYGNHPSFVMFTLGNELGREPAMFEMVAHFKKIDPRHLYAQGANNLHWDPSFAKGDDFWVTCKTSKGYPVRGSFFLGDFATPHIEHRPPSTMVDFTESIAEVSVPVVGHETGQFQISPDFSEIPKYTGVLKARNLEIFRERFAARNRLDQAEDFMHASGALAIICYREDIEAALRTPGFGGFQLLDLQDFPGQGTALVGILNAFMESKGLIKPEAWRNFCCETVPLLRMQKYTWTTDEKFEGQIQVAHYGPADLPRISISWSARDEFGLTIASGKQKPMTVGQGKVSPAGMVRFDLAGLSAPRKIEIEVTLEDTPYRNRYDFWAYAPEINISPPKGVRIARKLDRAALDHLEGGGKVLLLPELAALTNSVKGAFQTDFWCFPMFRRAAERNKIEVAPGILGILCDPKSPVLAKFPTESHSNWQWWHLVKNSRPIILDDAPADYRPLVQVIDNFERMHKLGLIFECKVSGGELLVCSIDLLNLQDKPEARQLLHSIVDYMGSDYFAPRSELTIGMLKERIPCD